MESLPTRSQASITKGLWFVFPLGEHIVRAWGSGLTGLERIYVDSVVVSERRSVGMESTHVFTVDDAEYAITFRTKSIFKGELECSLLKDGKVLSRYLARYSGPKPLPPPWLVFYAVLGAGIGFLVSFLKLPLWALLGFFAVFVLVFARTRKKGVLSVEEVDVDAA